MKGHGYFMKIKKIIDNKFNVGKVNKEKLLLKNFHFSGMKSEDFCEIYSYRFPVYEYKGHIVLYCELMLDKDTSDLSIYVFDKNNRLFAPFYYSEYGSYDKILNVININIISKLAELGISGATKMVEYK